jgi:hypothetical protein
MSGTAKDTGSEPAKRPVPPQLRAHVFKPGDVANPGGRPKGSGTFAGELAAILDEEVQDLRTGQKSTRRRTAAERLADLLAAGDLQAWAVVLQYCPEVATAQVAEQASGLCVTCGSECSSCHARSPQDEEALEAEALEVAKILAEAGFVHCPECQGALEARAQ